MGVRTIIFRGKRIDNGEWIEGFYGHSGDKTYIIIDNDIAVGYFQMKEVIPTSVSQFSGLCDKNGKKIFEGDILKGKHEWRNWNTSFGNDEKDFLEQKIRGAYGKYIDKTANEFIKWRYHYFRNYAVEYYAPNGGYRVRNGGQFHKLDQSYIFNRELEIIGNIHDNPELLRKEDEGK